jgi:hypothetical protein
VNAPAWIGLAVWLALGLCGAWLLITGRKTVFGLPRDFREGWPVRAFGLTYVVEAFLVAYGAYRAVRGQAIPGVYFPYGMALVAVVLLALLVWGGRQRATAADGGRPPA